MSGHHRRRDYEGYDLYIHRVNEQVNSGGHGMSERAMKILCSIVCDLERKLSDQARELTLISKSKTLSAREIQTAVRLLFPNELAKHAVSEGTKAVTKAVAYQPTGKDTTLQAQAGIVFPVGRIGRHLRTREYAKRVSAHAATYLAAVLEYITAEVLELAGHAARDGERKRINARFIMLAIENDQELHRLLGRRNDIFPGAGVLPNVHSILLPK